MENQKVLIIENDLFFTSRISETLKQIGLASVVAEGNAQISKCLHEFEISLIILDLSLDNVDPLTLIKRLKSDARTCDIPMIGFAEHTQRELLGAAKEIGCDIVVTNRGLVTDLKDLVTATLAEPSV